MQAWLQLTPKGASGTNRQMYGEVLPGIPDDFSHLPEFLHDIGTAGHSINGLIPLTHTEMEAWSRMTNMTLSRFEVRAIRCMSAAYSAIANNPEASCPIESEQLQEDMDRAHIAQWMAFAK